VDILAINILAVNILTCFFDLCVKL